MFFFMKELIGGAIFSQNHWRSQGVAEGTQGPLNQNATNDKICQNSLVSLFSVSFSIFAYIITRVQQ